MESSVDESGRSRRHGIDALLGEKDRVAGGFGELLDAGCDIDRVTDQGELQLARCRVADLLGSVDAFVRERKPNMNTKLMARTAAAAAALAIVAAFAVSCSHAKQAGSAATSAAGAGASAATSAAGAAASAASSVVSSFMAGAPTSMNVPGVGEVALDGVTAAKYRDLGGEAALGLPTGQPEKVGNGTAQAFAKGTIYSSPSTDAYLVRGEILRIYLAQGGPAGPLGFPTNDETESAGGPDIPKGGWISEFEHGSISWLNQGDGTFKETVTKK